MKILILTTVVLCLNHLTVDAVSFDSNAALQQTLIDGVTDMTKEYINQELTYLNEEQKEKMTRALDQLKTAPQCCNAGGSGGGGGFGYTCPPGYTYAEELNSCYMMVTSLMTYRQAEAVCRSFTDKGRLVVMNNLAKSQEIRKTIYTGQAGCDDFWIGAQRKNMNDCRSEFVWKLSKNVNETLSYNDFTPGEPNCAGGNEYCAEVWGRWKDRFEWNDRPCDYLRCALCEIPL